MARLFDPKEIEITIECLPEEIPIQGNAIASGDDALDRETENAIIVDLDNGNDWAWCTVRVSASWGGFTGTDYLGACSYASEEAFREAGGYYNDMVAEATRNLLDNVLAAGWTVSMPNVSAS